MPTLLNNRYKIIQALATGGFGHTFLAEDTHLPSRRRCVIKQLKPVTNNPQTHQLVQERFQREAAILEKLGEGNSQIPQLYAYFEEAGQFYLVQEWIEGQTLTDKLRAEGVFSDRAVHTLLIGILPVLDYIHSQGIIHRDIKPDNIILRQQDGKPVLIDFGALKETMTTMVSVQGNPTHSMVIGTPGFMPSEQASGRPIFASDLYSLGLTAIYLLTGKQPQELGMDSQTGEFIWRQYAPNMSPQLAAVLDRAIRSHPQERYATARQMLNDLQSGATPVTPGVPSQQATMAVSPGRASARQIQATPSGEWKKAVAIAGSVICASLIIGFVVAKTRQPSSPSRPKAEPSVVQRQPSPEPPVVIPSPEETTPPPPPSPTFSPSPSPTASVPLLEPITPPPTPSPTPQQTEETPAANLPSDSSVPVFPVGTPARAIEAKLGQPTKASNKGFWPNTRTAMYEIVPNKIDLGYIYDRNSGLLRQTEVSFDRSVDLEQMQATLNQMLGGRANAEIRQRLRRVYQGQADQYFIETGNLEGLIKQNPRDRIYIGVWDADFH